MIAFYALVCDFGLALLVSVAALVVVSMLLEVAFRVYDLICSYLHDRERHG